MKCEQLILEKLEKIEKEVEIIKEHMVDVDTLLTAEERTMLDESIQHERNGALISLEEVENALSEIFKYK